MDTQNIHTFFSVNTVGYYMTEVNPVQSNQVEAFQPQSAAFKKFKDIAFQQNIVPHVQSNVQAVDLDTRVVEAALDITLHAAYSMYFNASYDTKVTTLFTSLNGKNGITYDTNENKLHYKNLEITVSKVNGKFEANIFMRGCNDIDTLKTAIKEFYNAADITQTNNRFVKDGIFFPAVDVDNSELRHYYSTNDKSVVIDRYAYNTIKSAFGKLDHMIQPQFFVQKHELYNNNAKLQSATEQQLAFTYHDMQEINKLLREHKDNSNQDVANLQQVNLNQAQELEDLRKKLKILQSAFVK